ncbi:MAG: AsnC family transcriptional regulator, partial [Nanoarchaeota archaeon]|nr:AsnC family transcriptional regulator [Nanoarchaeota archaeon]
MSGRFDYGSEGIRRLDAKDKKILEVLSLNARLPHTVIGKQSRLSRESVSSRIKKLEDDGVILRFFPNINYERLGFFLFHIFFLVDEQKQERKKEFITYMKKHPSVYSFIEYSDSWDFEVVLVAKSLIDFDKIITEIHTDFFDLIIDKHRIELIKRFNACFSPFDTHIQRDFVREETQYVPDDIDIRLIMLLVDDCRASTYELGEKLRISPDSVTYRLKKLQKERVIKEFTTLIDFSKIGFHWYTHTIGMKSFNRSQELRFEEFIKKETSIIRSAKTLGGWDLILYIAVTNQREFHRIVG